MFVGRLGPLTVATALARRSRKPDWQHAEEDVMVG
jgi:Trk-type K+ transport system membrane component